MAANRTGILRRNKIVYKCALSNTISDVLASRDGWIQTDGDDWIFYWVTREWMNTQFDRHKFQERQLAEYHLFVEEFRKYPPNTIWIMKPVAGSQGKGIFLFKKLKDIQEWKKQDNGVEALPYVVQCYVQNPYLIGGKKFDVRLYVLVTSFRPLNVWVHREGFARFSHSRYDPSSVDDAFVHLTNVAIAKTAADYDPERGLKWSLSRLFRYFRAVHGHTPIAKMMTELGHVIIKSLRCVENLIIQDSHCFELYGYDILFDDNLKPWLLEVNASPSLTASSQDDFELKSRVLNHMLDVLDIENRLTGTEKRVGNFDLLVKNGTPVDLCKVTERTAPLFVPALNLRLGDFKPPKTSI